MDPRPTGATRLADVDRGWTESLDRLRSFVIARVGDEEIAADIVQDVIVRSIASGALEHVDNPVGWLYRSARNAVIDHYRTRRSHERLDGRYDRMPDRDSDDHRPNPATRELARCLRPLVHQLAPIYRDAVARVDLDGQTHQQAADQLGITVSGMKSRVQRGRRQLKEMLMRCCAVHVDRTGAVAGYQPAGTSCGCATS